MNTFRHLHINGHGKQLGRDFFRAAVISLCTWLIAVICTLLSITVHLTWGLISAITRVSFKCMFYLVLGTLLFCAAFVLIVLSIITLGTISLP